MDDFNFGDRDEFGFGEEEEEFEPFADLDLGDEDVDIPEFAEAPEEERAATIFGLSRPFFFILLGGGAFFCIVVIVLAVLILGTRGPSDLDYTVTAVLANNTQVQQFLNQTETQNAIFRDQTATATLWTPTPTVTPTETPSPSPSATPTEAAPTEPLFFTPTPFEGGGGPSVDEVALTATALAILLGEGPPTAVALGATPTPIGVPTGQLPTTGLFDEIGAEGGANGLFAAGLAALGLAAVIVVARRLRNNQ